VETTNSKHERPGRLKRVWHLTSLKWRDRSVNYIASNMRVWKCTWEQISFEKNEVYRIPPGVSRVQAMPQCVHLSPYIKLELTEIVWEKCDVVVQKSLSRKKIFWKKKLQTRFKSCLGVNLPTVTFWQQSDKFPLNFSFLQCPHLVKKLIRENSPKFVNQMGNFYFRPKRKTAISLFQWFLF